MSMHGIDISSYQAGIDTTGGSPPLDFVIVKATQGVSYVNPDCARAVDAALAAGKAAGVYHYIDGSGAGAEADFFADQIAGWVGRVLICLDWEPGSNSRWGDLGYLGAVIDRVRERTGRPPVVYASAAAFPWQVCGGRDCGTWVAQYASMDQTGYQDRPWNEGAYDCLIRQYSATGRLPGWGADLDLDIFYGSRATWDAYVAGAGPQAKEEDMITDEDINRIRDRILDTTVTRAGLPEGDPRAGKEVTIRAILAWLDSQFTGIPAGVWNRELTRQGLPDSDPRAGKTVQAGTVLSYADAMVADVKAAAAAAARDAAQGASERQEAEPGTIQAAPLADDVYIIRAGETLRAIAEAHGTTVQAIAAANPGLEPNRLVAGQRITIPAKES